LKQSKTDRNLHYRNFSEEDNAFHVCTNVIPKPSVTTHNKEQVIGFLKGQQNVKQDCSTTYTVMEQSGNYSLAKVEIKYRDFSKVDYVTLSKEGADWKINQVVTTYK
jgi:hypothetical protein